MPQAIQPSSSSRPGADADPARAWGRYEPSPDCPWNLARAGHLYRRAGFGATWGQLQQALKAGPQQTVDALLAGGPEAAAFNRACDNDDNAVVSVQALPAWWLRRMIATPHPLLEKLTLFWHDLFAVSTAHVDSAPLLRGHLRRLRAGALGDFRALIAQVFADPAIFLSLGAQANRKARPDENLARQLLHRYTVGADRCGEKDVREVSRAMTGWFVLRGELRHFQREHDDGDKTVLGTTANLDAAGVVALAAGHKDTARNLVRKLYHWFLSETDEPDETLLAPLIDSFARDFDVGRLVATMLRSNLFFSAGTLRRRVKRPVEFAVGIVRALEAAVSTTRLATDLAALGEDLCCPPTPAGWAAGRHWINPATLIGRGNLAASLLAPAGPYEGRIDPAAFAKRHGHAEDEAGGRFLADLLLQGDPGDDMLGRLWNAPPPAGALTGRLREFACRIATQPEFQFA
jgi:uncharacterized protein (DUF1800 family)